MKEMTVEELAMDVLYHACEVLEELRKTGFIDSDKEKYLQYAPQVFQMCSDFVQKF